MSNIDIEKINSVLGKAVSHFQDQDNEVLSTVAAASQEPDDPSGDNDPPGDSDTNLDEV